MEQLIDGVRQHATAYPRIPWGDFDKAMASDDPEARAAYIAVRDAHERYIALRWTQRMLYDDPQREFVYLHEIKNIRQLWPNMAYRSASNRPPWPQNKEERLVWLATSKAVVWMPTMDELDREESRQVAAARAKSGYPGNAAIGVRGPE